MTGDYQLVPLADGAQTLFSASYGEKLHPGLGPQAEADLLYVRQLKIRERLQSGAGEFVIWDIGLGAAANAIAALRATREISGQLRLVSFDNTDEPLAFALKNASLLGYVSGYEKQIEELLQVGAARCAVRTPQRGVPTTSRVEFENGKLKASWEFHLGDFPTFLANLKLKTKNLQLPAPHAIFYDAFSPAKNPAMWTLPVFENLFHALDPARPCALTTYSRSTLIRATLLLAGFFVGVGHATGMKEETTIAANDLSLIAEPLNARWLERALRSASAEPLHEPLYRRQKLSPETWSRLRAQPQFKAKVAV